MLALSALAAASAHEIRPAYLDLKETAPGQYDVLVADAGPVGHALPLVLQMPEGVRDLRPPRTDELTDSRLERRWIDAGPAGLEGKRIDFLGLQLTITDVLVRIERLDGAHSTEIVRPSRPYLEIPAPRGALATASAFLLQGIEHILFGADHLLFVLGLLLIVRSPLDAGQDHQRLHGRAQPHARRRDARLREHSRRRRSTPRSRCPSCSLGRRSFARGGARPASPSAIPGSSPLPSASCTASASPAAWPRSACRAATFRSRC